MRRALDLRARREPLRIVRAMVRAPRRPRSTCHAMIPILNLTRQHAALEPELLETIRDVLRGGAFINGSQVTKFERELADYIGTEHAVGLNSGTDALHLALRALDIGPGDEVITTPFTFVATTEAIGIVGATPVFADIDPE